MIPKSAKRFSGKIMLERKTGFSSPASAGDPAED
jgi:hypothetical protein